MTKFDRMQEHELRRDQDVVRYHLVADRGKFIRNSEFSTMICDYSLWMRSTLCHDQVIKWAKATKSACPLRFSLVSGKAA